MHIYTLIHWGNLGFSILPKDNSTCGLEESDLLVGGGPNSLNDVVYIGRLTKIMSPSKYVSNCICEGPRKITLQRTL